VTNGRPARRAGACNHWAQSVYVRLSRGKARKKQAIVAVARKLLVRCWAMLRDGEASLFYHLPLLL
jgi:hypothetical protein